MQGTGYMVVSYGLAIGRVRSRPGAYRAGKFHDGVERTRIDH